VVANNTLDGFSEDDMLPFFKELNSIFVFGLVYKVVDIIVIAQHLRD
jgi:hypothetical protein